MNLKYDGKNRSLDLLEPYLQTIFNFVGIEEIQFINVQPMDMVEKMREQKILEAQEKAIKEGQNA